ncbi:kinase-like domain-containing protein [Xylariaceae sp. FL0016]|nr:kinase-like domain-containing protein [Xylariaceae sp. FL0016]
MSSSDEEGCFAVTFERKYYHRGSAFIKRSLRPREFRTGHRGLHVPRLRNESLMNEAASLRFIRQHTDIPVPALYCDFKDDDAYYLVMEYVQGVAMSELSENQKAIVSQEIQEHLGKLKTPNSNRLGGPSGLVIPPNRVRNHDETDDWRLQSSGCNKHVFCHNDPSQYTIIVNPNTLRSTQI